MPKPSVQPCFTDIIARPLDALACICVFAVGAVGVSVKDVTSSTLALLFLLSLFHARSWKRGWSRLSASERYLLAGLLLFTLSGFLSWFNNADHYEYVKQMGRYLRFTAAVPVYLYLRGRSFDLSGWLLGGVSVSGFVYLALALHSYFINPDIPAASGYHHITFGDAAMLNAGIIAAMLLSMRFHPLVRFVLIASMLCALYASILSQSRGAWIALPAYMLLFGIYSVRIGGIRKWVLALGLFVLLAALAPIDNMIVKRYDEATQDIERFISGDEFDTSVGGRLAMWDIAIDVWREHPLLGTGLGDYDNDLVRYQKAGKYPLIDVHGSVHNIYIQTLSTTGMIGFVASLFAIVILPLWLFMSSTGWRHPLRLAGIVLVISYALFGLSESWILRAPVVSLFTVYLVILASSLHLSETAGYRLFFSRSTVPRRYNDGARKAGAIAPTAVMCFSSGNGGMERSAVRLADMLSQITRTTLVCKKSSFIENLYRHDEHMFDCVTVDFSSRIFSPAMLVKVRELLNAREYGNVIFFGASELKTLYFAFLGHDLNLVVWHGTTKHRPKHDFFHRLVYSDVNYHVALSAHLIRNVRSIVPPGRHVQYRVIYPSFRINVELRVTDAPVIHDPLKLVHIGRVVAGKGQVDAVQACNSLYEAGIAFELDLVGPPGDEKYSRQLSSVIEHASYRDSIHLRGFVDDPVSYLEQADLLLFPSHGEGMPNAFIEALHYGLPCLAYDNTVFPEYLDMGFHVTLATDRDTAELSTKLLHMAVNIKQEKRDAVINGKLAREYFNVERELDSWLAILI